MNQDEKDYGVAVPLPADAPNSPRHPILGIPDKWWIYRNAAGQPILFVCRFYKKNGDKQDRPLTYRQYADGSFGWEWKSTTEPRVIYNLDLFSQHPEKPVLVCEGEKATEAAGELFPDFLTTTSPNGSGSPHKADWSPVKGRRIVIWPDNDDAGRKYANAVAQIALKLGALSVHIVQIPEDFTEGWDLADQLPSNYTLDDLRALLNRAELAKDPYESLIEQCKKSPGEAFREENLALLSKLQLEDQCAFETFRSKLKNETDVRLTQLDRALAKADSTNASEQTQVDILLMLASAAELFHGPDKAPYAQVMVNGHREIWRVKSTTLKLWLIHQYFEEIGTAPNAESLNATINALCAKALHSGPKRDVFIRTARQEGKLYVDLCNDEWSVVEIDSEGWRLVKEHQVCFVRSSGMLALPMPTESGSINDLRPLLNINEDEPFVLFISWLLGSLIFSSEYPILTILGEYGSAKSSFCEYARRLVDPNTALLRTLHKDERDLYISAFNSYILGYDNISTISDAISDALCRIATGGGFSTRALYTDDEERIFSATRPIILNGIEDIVTRSDLADRCIVITLNAIPEDQRKLKSEIEQQFNTVLPGVLGELFRAMAHGLKNQESLRTQNLPRMADFARWVCACESAFWPAGTFMKAYNTNRLGAMDVAIESCSVARAIIQLMDSMTVWTGSATDFLNYFYGNIEYSACHDWPKNPEGVSGAIRRMSEPLKSRGIKIKTGERAGSKKRLITISRS